MKKLLIASAAIAVAAPAFANDVSFSGTFDAEFHTDDFESGDGDVNTLTVVIDFEGNGYGATVTLDPTGLNGASTSANDDIVDDYKIYADIAIGRISIGTSDGTTTDDDAAETGSAVDFDKGFNELTDSSLTVIDTLDGPVEGSTVAVSASVANPSMTYSTPDIGGLSFALTWGSNNGGVADYVLALGYSNDTLTAALDIDEDGDYVLEGKLETEFGNLILEVATDSKYEARFETDLASVGTPLQAALYLNSEETFALDMRYDISDTLYTGLSYTKFGDTLTSGSVGAGLAALGISYDTAFGGVSAWGVGVGTVMNDVDVLLSYEKLQDSAVSSLNKDRFVLSADFGVVKLAYDADAEELAVGITAEF